jgi:hypothetical protein
MDKLLFEESICNVGTIVCYSLNYCQYLPHEKTTLNVRKKFWKIFYEDKKVYGLDIPRQLCLKANVKKWKFIIIHGVKDCEKACYNVMGLAQSPYMLYKWKSWHVYRFK